MSKRSDITTYAPGSNPTYGLIYTARCGWIDLGHANPTGPGKLWSEIKQGQLACHGTGYSRAKYTQQMRKFNLNAGVSREYCVRDSLTLEQQKSVALSIFMGVSLSFEALQSNWFFGLLTDSGFSSEDLVSDLVGFYRAVSPGPDYIKMCEPMSKDYSLRVWDTFGSSGSIKNFSFGPFLYDLGPRVGAGGGRCGPLPDFLSRIKPAPAGQLFIEASALGRTKWPAR